MKKRIDNLASEKFGISRAKAQALIMAGEVFAEDRPIIKAGQLIDDSTNIMIREKFPYVSRGALKLERAYQEFGLNFKDKVICDIGASTGGFTDFSLQSGAKKVYAIDTGKGQIAQKLRDNPRVILMENTNIKSVNALPESIDYFVIDVSFISLKKILPQVITIIRNSKLEIRNSSVIALIKPQFEVGKKIADKTKGVIRDENIQLTVVKEIGQFAESIGYSTRALTESPITGAKGNKEFLIYLRACSYTLNLKTITSPSATT